MLLYHQHASVKDERHPHVDEKSPGHYECTSLTQYVCITHAIQVLARWLVMSAIPAAAACVLRGAAITPLASSGCWFREAGIHVIDSTYSAPVFACVAGSVFSKG
jgi:hypothetical protein